VVGELMSLHLASAVPHIGRRVACFNSHKRQMFHEHNDKKRHISINV
jgi:hypothetical protein